MSHKVSVGTSRRKPAAPLTPEQERFRYLIRQIEKARAAHEAAQRTLDRFRTEHSQRLQPLRASLLDLSRRTVASIDGLLEESTWSRLDRVMLQQILCSTADALLAANPADAEMRTLFEKHSEVSLDALRQEEIERLREEAEELTGLDLGDDEIRSEDDLVQRMYEQMAEREAEEETAESARSSHRRESAASRRIQAAAQLAKQSLREIYRKLASIVHPDREADPQRREEKNALMQRINQAYAASDLLSLLEMQVQLGHSDAERFGGISAPRLKQYNKLLAQQLKDARASQEDLEMAFRMDFGLDPDSTLSPQQLNIVTQRQARAMRVEIARQKEFLSLLSNKAATRRWLRDQRRLG